MNGDEGSAHSAASGWALEFSSIGACIRFCENQPLLDVLRSIKHGGADWMYRYVTLRYPGSSSNWMLLYPFQDSKAPYFDFMYGTNADPQQVLEPLFERYPQCSIIDWSRGRLACLEAVGVDVESLAEIMQEVARLVWGERNQLVDGWYEEMGRA